jgi:GNAT superfamily N-acetyltransferase
MEIRQAHEGDIPAIVELLKLSLGESLMPKSEAFWRWKHLDNPFGKSPVLLAFHGNLLVGVRAFMRWEWRMGDRIYKAVRAVDTATHPEHQGKGIFKKLTLKLVQQCQREGVDFIFNTPNKSSKPGYLKMGWKELGRLKVGIRPVLRFSTEISPQVEETFKWNSAIMGEIQVNASAKAILTHYTPGFFHWRYGANPNVRYYLAGDDAGQFVIFRLKKHRIGTEFRVVDAVMADGVSANAFSELLWHAIDQSGARLVTIAGEYLPHFFLPMKVGPVVTIKPLNMDKAISFGNWKPSLGDMEVF